jgi:hypothetical protein
MAGQEPGPNGDNQHAPATPPTGLVMAATESVEQADGDLQCLGRALQARAEDVLALTVERTTGSGQDVDTLIQDSFERICKISTVAVARWIAGDGLEVTNPAARETGYIFGQLAAHRAASLQLPAVAQHRRRGAA